MVSLSHACVHDYVSFIIKIYLKQCRPTYIQHYNLALMLSGTLPMLEDTIAQAPQVTSPLESVYAVV